MSHHDSSQPAPPREIAISGDSIALGALLKWAGLASTGGEAKQLIQEGQVVINGQTETRRRRRVLPGDVVVLQPSTALRVVGGGSTP